MVHSTPIIHANDLVRRFSPTRGEVTTVLDGIDLDIYEGDYIALVGPSGSGKTTLLSCLSGLDRPSEGTVMVDGTELASLDDRALSRLRRDTQGFVFQRTDLLDELLVLDNILLPAYRRRGRIPKETLATAARLMRRLDIAHLADHRPAELSGGQRQRVGICRALINEPRVLFADEPTGALHTEAVDAVLELFDELSESGTTIVVVTHDPRVSQRARILYRLVDGRMSQAIGENGDRLRYSRGAVEH